MNPRKAFASEIRKALISGNPPEWREALGLLEGHPLTHAKTPLEDLAALDIHLVVMLTRYHLKVKGKFMNPTLMKEVNKQWELWQ
jgi:hypothetical protein